MRADLPRHHRRPLRRLRTGRHVVRPPHVRQRLFARGDLERSVGELEGRVELVFQVFLPQFVLCLFRHRNRRLQRLHPDAFAQPAGELLHPVEAGQPLPQVQRQGPAQEALPLSRQQAIRGHVPRRQAGQLRRSDQSVPGTERVQRQSHRHGGSGGPLLGGGQQIRLGGRTDFDDGRRRGEFGHPSGEIPAAQPCGQAAALESRLSGHPPVGDLLHAGRMRTARRAQERGRRTDQSGACAQLREPQRPRSRDRGQSRRIPHARRMDDRVPRRGTPPHRSDPLGRVHLRVVVGPHPLE